MAVNLRGVTTVLLPGTGSDDDYVYRAFSAAMHEVGAVVVTPAPQPDRLIDGYRNALDNAARADPIAVGGVSINNVMGTEANPVPSRQLTELLSKALLDEQLCDRLFANPEAVAVMPAPGR